MLAPQMLRPTTLPPIFTRWIDKVRGTGARAYVREHWRPLALTFTGGAATLLAVISIAGLSTISFGLYNTTATAPHPAAVAWALHTTFNNSVRRRSAGIVSPVRFTPAQVQAGFRQYEADCVMCHGGPGVARANWVQQIVPTPPYVIDASRRFTPAQLYFILWKGVKMSAMPAWGETRSRAELWNYVAFLETLPTLSAGDYARLRASLGQCPAVKDAKDNNC